MDAKVHTRASGVQHEFAEPIHRTERMSGANIAGAHRQLRQACRRGGAAARSPATGAATRAEIGTELSGQPYPGLGKAARSAAAFGPGTSHTRSHRDRHPADADTSTRCAGTP